MWRPIVTAFISFALTTNVVHADDHDGATTALELPKAVGEPHPEGNEFMRVNHMNLLKHDRDDTVLLGDRGIAYSLKGCVACHAVVGQDAMPIPINDDKQFCAVCHEYVAVRIDCFQCHNDLPDPEIRARLISYASDLDALTTYVAEVSE